MRNSNMRDDDDQDDPPDLNTRQNFWARIETLHCLFQEHDVEAVAIKATWGWGRIMHKFLREIYFGQKWMREMLNRGKGAVFYSQWKAWVADNQRDVLVAELASVNGQLNDFDDAAK